MMKNTIKVVKVGIAQFSPVILNRSESVDKACAIIAQAGQEGVKLLAFPESWLCGYPVWVDWSAFAEFDSPKAKKLYAKFYEACIEINGSEVKQISEACKKSGVCVAMGINEIEKNSRSIYNSLIIIDERGELQARHQKLVPTHGERLIWAPGKKGNNFKIYNSEFARIGGLICWEHWMPLARQALHKQREDIHIAAWPSGKEMHQIASRHYAFEGRCFTLSSCSHMTPDSFPNDFEFAAELLLQKDRLPNGGSAVIGPDGSYITAPLFDCEKLITADIDLNRICEESLTLDVCGHSSRPDIFEFRIL